MQYPAPFLHVRMCVMTNTPEIDKFQNIAFLDPERIRERDL